MILNKGVERRYTLRIAGRDYTITSSDAPEHVHRVAVYIDRKIAEMASSGFVNRESAAVIAGMAVADELLTAQDDNTRLRRELMQARQELRDIKSLSAHAEREA
ncbi:MAG: cell division protein ZapA [Clostridia bacterium]|nr:cell division protein ZapA [Clostridia bacterium]